MDQTDASAAVLRNLEAQAVICDTLGSPFSAKVCRALAAGLDRSTATGRRALGWPGDATADALALRLLGALHALVLSGADDGSPRCIRRGRLAIPGFATRSPTQYGVTTSDCAARSITCPRPTKLRGRPCSCRVSSR